MPISALSLWPYNANPTARTHRRRKKKKEKKKNFGGTLRMGLQREWERDGRVVSPMSQGLSTKNCFSLFIYAVFELEEKADLNDSTPDTMAEMVSRIPCLSYMMKRDKKGTLRWVKAELEARKHLVVVEFDRVKPKDGEEERFRYYDEMVEEYIRGMPLLEMDESRPLWELHVINYRTRRAESTAVWKAHHSLGDGISLMASMFSIVYCADDPLRPPTIPGLSNLRLGSVARKRHQTSEEWPGRRFLRKIKNVIIAAKDTVGDVGGFAVRSSGCACIDDAKYPTRVPANIRIENEPGIHAYSTFALTEMKAVKNNMKGTLNDVICGVIFYGFRKYLHMQMAAEAMNLELEDVFRRRSEILQSCHVKIDGKVTAVLPVNVRVLRGLPKINEMLKAKTQVPWGNHFSIFLVPVPIKNMVGPKEAITLAKHLIDRRKRSLGFFINLKLAKALSCLSSPEAISKSLHNLGTSTSLFISNVIGPSEKVGVAGNTIKSFSFFLSGLPLTPQFTIVSYVDKVVMHVVGHPPYVNANILGRCLEEAFGEIKMAFLPKL